MEEESGDATQTTLTFRIFGRSHPERQGWWFDAFRVETGDASGNRTVLHGEMRAGNFHARLDITGVDERPVMEPMDAKVVLETFVRGRLDTLGLLHGAAVDCEVVQLELPNGDVQVLSTAFGGLKVDDSQQRFLPLSIVAELIAGIRLGMADFRQAIRAPIDTALFCYRGLDGIRADIAMREKLKTDADSWLRMRQVTGLDRETDIEPVKELADLRRHGNETTISSDQRAMALRVLQRALLSYSDWCQENIALVRNVVRRTRAYGSELGP